MHFKAFMVEKPQETDQFKKKLFFQQLKSSLKSRCGALQNDFSGSYDQKTTKKARLAIEGQREGNMKSYRSISDIRFCCVELQRVSTYKYLGLVLDERLSFDALVNHVW